MCKPPLIGKPDVIDTKHFRAHIERGITVVDVYLKDRVDESKEFYKRYRVMPHLLDEEEPKAFTKWVEYTDKNNLQPNYLLDEFEEYEFQCWLFDYCFGDITK